MKAFTVYQPWATLIMIGAKPVEWRRWDYRTRERGLEGQRIVIHASARPIKLLEVEDILRRLETGDTSLIREKAEPLLHRIQQAYKCRGVVELSAGLGTAVLKTPRNVDALFKAPDSDRIDHHMWGWPLADVRRFEAPVPARGLQGFWNWPEAVPA